MLTHIQIHNFTIVESLSLDFYSGLTVLTGETGAGKSILIDAIRMAIGERTSPNCIRSGCEKTEVCLQFDISAITSVQNWLVRNELDADNECILRRIIGKEGRSRAFINNHPVPVQRLRDLGQLLIDIHGQHAHHSLLNSNTHTKVIDEFADSLNLCQQIKAIYKSWQQFNSDLTTLKQSASNRQEKIHFLQFQIEELTNLNLQPDEWQTLVEEQKKLCHSETLTYETQQVLELIKDSQDYNLLSALHKVQQLLANTIKIDDSLSTTVEMLKNAEIQIQEAYYDVQKFTETVSSDPERLNEVEQRLALIHRLARKYHVEPEQLSTLLESLTNDLFEFQNNEETCLQLERELFHCEEKYNLVADKLTTKRKKAINQFTKIITRNLHQLGLPNAKFIIQLLPKSDKDSLSATGNETIQFLVSMNPGQDPQPLNKVASGGELSRTSLAIEVANHQHCTKPILIFDEVDVGIGGGVAEMVGHCLAELSNKAQVFCITHQAQVAAKANQHLLVYKKTVDKRTKTQIKNLKREEKIEELARMLGGLKITDKTRQHAMEMLEQINLIA